MQRQDHPPIKSRDLPSPQHGVSKNLRTWVQSIRYPKSTSHSLDHRQCVLRNRPNGMTLARSTGIVTSSRNSTTQEQNYHPASAADIQPERREETITLPDLAILGTSYAKKPSNMDFSALPDDFFVIRSHFTRSDMYS